MSARFTTKWLEGHLVDVSTLRRTDIVGIGHALAEIDGLIARLRHPARAAAMGVEPPRGILLWGEPGMGKTLIARYVAASLGPDEAPFYEVSADELSPDRIRGSMRYLAEHHPRSILYIDECDTFGMARDYEGHDAATRLLLTATLAALDGLTPTTGPVVIASSNRSPRHLDRALVRAGRLGFKLRFAAPSEEERVELLALFTRGIPCDPGIDWNHAARLTRGTSPADLRQLVADAAGIALAADRDAITEDDMLAAVRRDGRIEPEDRHDPDTLHRIAVHESGHVAVGVALRGGDWIYAVRIGPMGGSTEHGDEALPAAERPDDEIRDSLVLNFGGIAAEIAVFGEGTLGGRSDVSVATQTALGRIAAGITNDPAPMDLEWLDKNVADSIKETVAGRLVEQLATARTRAGVIASANVAPILRFAAVLEASGELSGPALQAAIVDAGFVTVGT